MMHGNSNIKKKLSTVNLLTNPGPVSAGQRLKHVKLKNKSQTINSGPLGETTVRETGCKLTSTKAGLME